MFRKKDFHEICTCLYFLYNDIEKNHLLKGLFIVFDLNKGIVAIGFNNNADTHTTESTMSRTFSNSCIFWTATVYLQTNIHNSTEAAVVNSYQLSNLVSNCQHSNQLPSNINQVLATISKLSLVAIWQLTIQLLSTRLLLLPLMGHILQEILVALFNFHYSILLDN